MTELNLRRNRLEVVEGLDELPSLQRLFLSNNNVTSFDNIDCIFKVRARDLLPTTTVALHRAACSPCHRTTCEPQTRSLVELAIDGNPVVSANLDSYRQTLVNRIRSLKHLVCHHV